MTQPVTDNRTVLTVSVWRYDNQGVAAAMMKTLRMRRIDASSSAQFANRYATFAVRNVSSLIRHCTSLTSCPIVGAPPP